MPKLLADKIALISGGAGGMGRAVALRFADEGARVVLLDKDEVGLEATASLVRQAGGEALVKAADITQISQIDEIVKVCADAFGGLDILYNNAGVSIARPIEEVDEAFWDLVQAINVKAHFFITKSSLPYLRQSSGGTVINVGSVSGVFGINGQTVYCVSKGGIHQMTKAMAAELADEGIRVNAIAPGVVATQMVKHALEHLPDEEQKAVVASWTGRQLFNRPAEPEEIASVAVFLASDQSSFLTGEIINASAGWAAN